MTTIRPLVALVVLLALTGTAAAQAECPECDADGPENPNNTYHSIDVGFVENHTEVLADTDLAHSHESSDSFWAWLSICLSAFLGHFEEALGINVDADANADVFVSEKGVDVDATAYLLGERVDFDESEVGDLDGMSWDAIAQNNVTLPQEVPRGTPDYEGAIVDACVTAEASVVACG